MKKILFDFLTFEDDFINGGALTVKSIFYGLTERNCNIVGFCKNINGVSREIKDYARTKNIPIEEIDLSKGVAPIIEKHSIDVVFIGIGQRFKDVKFDNVQCPIYIIFHDISDICIYNADLLYRIDDLYMLYKLNNMKYPWLRCLKYRIKRMFDQKSILGLKPSLRKQYRFFGYESLADLVNQKNVHIITVSEYSRNSLQYYFENIANEITVLYPYPTSMDTDCNECVNFDVKSFGEYFLFISADRYNKNVCVFLRQFEKLNKKYNYRFQAVIVGFDDIGYKNVTCLKSVNNNELILLQKNCYALIYASFGEGFGMPPIEVMSYGKPVIAAFSTSIPEICGDAALYFNPAYQEDLFLKETMLIENYNEYTARVRDRASEIAERQRTDGERLLNLLTE